MYVVGLVFVVRSSRSSIVVGACVGVVGVVLVCVVVGVVGVVGSGVGVYPCEYDEHEELV